MDIHDGHVRAERSEAEYPEIEDLPSILRRETADLHTADLHTAVETATVLPGSMLNRVDYQTLLYRLHGFHQAAEVALTDSRWAQTWSTLGIDPRLFQRSHLIEKDLHDRQAPPPGRAFPITGIASFPGMLASASTGASPDQDFAHRRLDVGCVNPRTAGGEPPSRASH